MRVDALMQETATQAVARAAEATGVDFSLLLETAKRESGLNGNARAGTSSAAGLFQFIESTWMDLVQRYGAKYGIKANAADPAQRQSILDLRFDPDLAARMAGELTRENAGVLQAKLGREASRGELYAAHVLGPDGAARLIRAAEAGQANAAALFPKAAAANRAIFYDKTGAARSAGAVLAKLDLDGAGAPAPAVTAEPKARPLSPASFVAPLLGPSSPFVWAGQMSADLWDFALRAYSSANKDDRS
jgi:hypothetical protein